MGDTTKKGSASTTSEPRRRSRLTKAQQAEEKVLDDATDRLQAELDRDVQLYGEVVVRNIRIRAVLRELYRSGRDAT